MYTLFGACPVMGIASMTYTNADLNLSPAYWPILSGRGPGPMLIRPLDTAGHSMVGGTGQPDRPAQGPGPG